MMEAPMVHVAPLSPAGHLPREGGDQPSLPISQITSVAGVATTSTPPISPLAGEMSGRTEGGAKERSLPVSVNGAF